MLGMQKLIEARRETAQLVATTPCSKFFTLERAQPTIKYHVIPAVASRTNDSDRHTEKQGLQM